MTDQQNDQSYGIIPLQKRKGSWYVLLVQLHAGHWGFPKGHAESGETHFEAAKRELFEETGLIVTRLLCDETFEESYYFKHAGILIHKTVIYFLAEVEGKEIMQDLEVKDLKWVLLDSASTQMTFEQGRSLCLKAQEILHAF